MFKQIRELLINDDELDDGWQRFLSLTFLFIAGMLCFFTYTHESLLWGHKVWEGTLKIKPGFISTIIAVLLIAPLYLRNIFKWNRSVYTIISFILILLVFASFIELASGGNSKNSIVNTLIALSIVLSWLGIRGIAGISWILVIAATVYSTITNNIILGFYGFIYISSGFLGLLLHTGLNPGAFMKCLKDEYSNQIIDTANIAKTEVETTGAIAKNIS